MANFDLPPAGSALFSGSENFLTDLSQEDESMITGGTGYDNSKSDDSSKKKKKQNNNYKNDDYSS